MTTNNAKRKTETILRHECLLFSVLTGKDKEAKGKAETGSETKNGTKQGTKRNMTTNRYENNKHGTSANTNNETKHKKKEYANTKSWETIPKTTTNIAKRKTGTRPRLECLLFSVLNGKDKEAKGEAETGSETSNETKQGTKRNMTTKRK